MALNAHESLPAPCESCGLAQHAVYGGGGEHARQVIQSLRRRRFEVGPDRALFRKGEIPEVVYTLFSGWAYKYTVLEDGGRQVLLFYIPGDLILAQAMRGAPLPCAVRTLTKVTLCEFDRAAFFETMMGSDSLRPGLGRYMFESHDATEELLTAIGRRSATARVARFLHSLERRLRRRALSVNGTFTMPIPQTLIADTLGLTPAYVNRVFASLREKRVIDLQRHRMRILDAGALEELAEIR